MAQGGHIDQGTGGDDDGGRQHRHGQGTEQSCGKQQHQGDQQGGKHPRERRICARIGVDCGAGEAPGNWQRPRQATGDIGGAEPQQFGVSVDPLAVAAGETLGDGHTLDEAHKANDQRGQPQLCRQVEVNGGGHRPRQTFGNGPNHRQAVPPVEQQHQNSTGEHHHHGCQAGGEGSRPRCHAEPGQQGCETYPGHTENHHRGDPNRRGQGLKGAGPDLGDDTPQQAQRRIAIAGDAQQRAQLADDDEQRGAADKAADHRVTEKLGEGAEAQQAEGKQHSPGQQGQGHGAGDILGRTRHRHRRQGRRGHQGDHRHRPHRHHHRGPKKGVGHQREDAGVQAELGRQSRQGRVGKPLGNHQQGHHQGRRQVPRQVAASVSRYPGGNQGLAEYHLRVSPPQAAGGTRRCPSPPPSTG